MPSLCGFVAYVVSVVYEVTFINLSLITVICSCEFPFTAFNTYGNSSKEDLGSYKKIHIHLKRRTPAGDEKPVLSGL